MKGTGCECRTNRNWLADVLSSSAMSSTSSPSSSWVIPLDQRTNLHRALVSHYWQGGLALLPVGRSARLCKGGPNSKL